MLKFLYRLFFIFECSRLVLWLALIWHVSSAGPTEHHEAVVFTAMAVSMLGFPYSWSVAMLIGDWSFVSAAAGNRPMSIVYSHFILWMIMTAVLLVVIRKRVRG